MDKSTRFNTIAKYLKDNSVPHYRLSQIFNSIYRNKTPNFLSMYHLPKILRNGLHDNFEGSLLSLTPVSESNSDRAKKVLFQNSDGSRIEAVLLHFNTHKSLCISAQVGCSYACSFCATGKIGLKRNLTVDEITDQVLYFQQLGHKIDSISFMGMGEPLSNPNVFKSINILTDKRYFALSPRRINVSTVGILPGIKKLNKEYPYVNLAYSLHTPFTEERNEMVPVNLLYPFQEAYPLMDERIRQTGRRIWISYILIKDKNDTKEHVEELINIIKGRPKEVQYLYHVNLIPYNIGMPQILILPHQTTFLCLVKSIDKYESTEHDQSLKFEKYLRKNGISCSYRNYFGRNIDAACGQLFAGKYIKKHVTINYFTSEYDPIDPSKLFRPKVNRTHQQTKTNKS
uniref:Radical SAM superfamily, putative n=1 Tax=Theileria annulata TaxID=5874 RepID=A0A3B0MXI5_THEAN